MITNALSSIKKEFIRVPYLYLLPAFLIFSVFIVYPVIQSLYYSLHVYNGITPMKYAGLKNFAKLFSDKNFYITLKNTAIFTLLNVLIQSIIAMPLAVILNGDIKCRNFFKTVFFLPSIMSVVVIGYVFSFIFNPAFGVLNQVLHLAGLDFLAKNWLGDPSIALYTVIFVTCWQGIGYATVIYLGGLQNIPLEVNEAAVIDGAGGVKKFLFITFPLLAPVFTVAMLIATIANIKEFGRIYIMTGGGPAGSTEVFVTYLYKSFNDSMLGYGSAVAVVLFALLLVLSIFQSWILRKRENYL